MKFPQKIQTDFRSVCVLGERRNIGSVLPGTCHPPENTHPTPHAGDGKARRFFPCGKALPVCLRARSCATSEVTPSPDGGHTSLTVSIRSGVD